MYMYTIIRLNFRSFGMIIICGELNNNNWINEWMNEWITTARDWAQVNTTKSEGSSPAPEKVGGQLTHGPRGSTAPGCEFLRKCNKLWHSSRASSIERIYHFAVAVLGVWSASTEQPPRCSRRTWNPTATETASVAVAQSVRSHHITSSRQPNTYTQLVTATQTRSSFTACPAFRFCRLNIWAPISKPQLNLP